MTTADKKAAPARPAETIDPDDVQLTAEDMERIRAKARAKVSKERREALEAKALAKEIEALRGKEGLRTGNPEEDELVDLTIDCGDSADRIVINGRAYFVGQTYTVPKHMARSLMEIMHRTQLHEHSITDKPLADFFRKKRNTLVAGRMGKVTNRKPANDAPAAGADDTLPPFDIGIVMNLSGERQITVRSPVTEP